MSSKITIVTKKKATKDLVVAPLQYKPSSAYRKIVADPCGDLALKIRTQLTMKIFKPDEFQFGGNKSAGDSPGTERVTFYLMQPDGYLVPRFWELDNSGVCTKYRIADDPVVITHRQVCADNPRVLEINCKPKDEDQELLITSITESWDKCGGAMLRRFCGGGKTEICLMTWIKHRATQKNMRGKLGVLVAGLGGMWVKRIKARIAGVKVVSISGKSKPSQKEVDEADVVILSMHLTALSVSFSEYDLNIDYLVVDECHDIGGTKMIDAASRLGPYLFSLAVSATPDRMDGKGVIIYRLFGPQMPVLPRPKPNYPIFTRLMAVRMEDESKSMPPFERYYNRKQVFDRNKMFDYLHTSDRWPSAIIKAIMWHKQHVGPTIVFFRRLQTLKDVAATLREYCKDISVATLFGETSEKDRLIENPVDVILAYISVGRQGHDWPWLEGVIFATGLTGSSVQEVGRGRRDNPGKKHLHVTYLCPMDGLNADPTSKAHDKSVNCAKQQAEFYMRPRSDFDGLHADTIGCVNTDFEPIEPFIDMINLTRKTSIGRKEEDQKDRAKQQGLVMNLKRKAEGNSAILKKMIKITKSIK